VNRDRADEPPCFASLLTEVEFVGVKTPPNVTQLSVGLEVFVRENDLPSIGVDQFEVANTTVQTDALTDPLHDHPLVD